MMTPEIDRNIPVPPRRGEGPKYPLAAMAVGDSFFVDCELPEGPPQQGMELTPDEYAAQVNLRRRNVLANVSTTARRLRARAPCVRFTCRFVTENARRGVRVWRSE